MHHQSILQAEILGALGLKPDSMAETRARADDKAAPRRFKPQPDRPSCYGALSTEEDSLDALRALITRAKEMAARLEPTHLEMGAVEDELSDAFGCCDDVREIDEQMRSEWAKDDADELAGDASREQGS
jgi:hypothetical protein